MLLRAYSGKILKTWIPYIVGSFGLDSVSAPPLNFFVAIVQVFGCGFQEDCKSGNLSGGVGAARGLTCTEEEKESVVGF